MPPQYHTAPSKGALKPWTEYCAIPVATASSFVHKDLSVTVKIKASATLQKLTSFFGRHLIKQIQNTTNSRANCNSPSSKWEKGKNQCEERFTFWCEKNLQCTPQSKLFRPWKQLWKLKYFSKDVFYFVSMFLIRIEKYVTNGSMDKGLSFEIWRTASFSTVLNGRKGLMTIPSHANNWYTSFGSIRSLIFVRVRALSHLSESQKKGWSKWRRERKYAFPYPYFSAHSRNTYENVITAKPQFEK